MWHKDIFKLLCPCHQNILNIFVHAHRFIFSSHAHLLALLIVIISICLKYVQHKIPHLLYIIQYVPWFKLYSPWHGHQMLVMISNSQILHYYLVFICHATCNTTYLGNLDRLHGTTYTYLVL
jgi:hypothetical protein